MNTHFHPETLTLRAWNDSESVIIERRIMENTVRMLHLHLIKISVGFYSKSVFYILKGSVASVTNCSGQIYN